MLANFSFGPFGVPFRSKCAFETLKTTQDARQFLFGSFFGHSPTAWLTFDLEMRTRLTSNLILAVFWPFVDRMAHFYP